MTSRPDPPSAGEHWASATEHRPSAGVHPPAANGPPPSGDERPPPDLRLAGMALGTWLTALAALYLSARTGALLAAAAAVLATLSHLSRDGFQRPWMRFGRLTRTPRRVANGPVRRRIAAAVLPSRAGDWLARWRMAAAVVLGRAGDRPVRRRIAAAVLLGAVCGAGATAARVAVRDAPVLTDLADERTSVVAEVVVRDDPRLVGAANRPMYAVSAELRRLRPITDDQRQIDVRARVLVLATHGAWVAPLPGQRVRVEGRLDRPRGGDLTAAVISSGAAPELVGRPSWAQRAAGSLRAGLQRACVGLPAEAGGLLPGLVLGDTSRLDPAVEDDFKTTGLTHLTAVSGANVAIIIGFVLLVTRWCRAGRWTSAILCGVALVGFVILVRPSPSVVRAATMGAIGLMALASGRSRAAVPALAAAIVVLVVVDPELAGDAGFALSVLATGGLLLLAPKMRDWLRRRRVPPGIAEALAIPAAAQVTCGPVVAGLSSAVSLVSIPANLLAAPAVAPATVLGVFATICSAVWPAGAGFLAWVAHWPARWLVLIARHGANTPMGSLPWPGGVGGGLLLGALTLVLLVALRRRLARRLVAVVAVAAVVGALPVRVLTSTWPPTGWVVVACDIGQGDMAVLAAGSATAVVIDAGPDPASADSCLDRLGVRTVRLFVVSHFHADHIGGVEGIGRGRRIEAVATPRHAEPAAGRDQVLSAAAQAGATVAVIDVGRRLSLGAVDLVVFGPPVEMAGTRSDPNNNSLVLRATVDGVGVMLPGDAEEEEQRVIIDHFGGAALRAQVLKVAHHGSAYQEPSFVDAVDPAVALVSVGVDNGYGHPNPALLARLTRGGARVLRTDQAGDLAVVRRGGGLAVVASGGPRGKH
ncbi:competence protein ComEC [Asanoa hainanensis]|uniref:Competence protein ComEC n=1 Tax=Asanoa hainanensis TaxID=560556 RepID=A0A239MDK6_9ACTN|nr:ComEC/Rec2 family competence protein [Asanoa hainanensis]SNT40570.1 competence protein ComEC [Asanoa hainanensis]